MKPMKNPWMSAFLRGLSVPSGVSVLVACGSIFIAFATILAIGPRFMASDAYKLALSDGFDTYVRVSHQVLKGIPDEKPAVLVLGTSLMVSCVNPKNTLENQIADATGRDMHVMELASAAQTTWEMAAIVDKVRPTDGSVLVIGLSPGVLARGLDDGSASSPYELAKQPKLAFTSEAFDIELRREGFRVPSRTGVYFLDNASFYLARRRDIMSNVVRPTRYADPLDAPWMDHVNRPEFWQEEHEALPVVTRRYDTNLEKNFGVLSRMIERARKAKGVEIVILESPVHPGWYETEAGKVFFEAYRADLQRFAEEQRAHFASATELAGLKASDFVDFEGHLGNHPARERCTEAVGKSVIGSASAGQT